MRTNMHSSLLSLALGFLAISMACKPNRDRNSVASDAQLSNVQAALGEVITCSLDTASVKASSPRAHILPVGHNGIGPARFAYTYKKEYASDANLLSQAIQYDQNNLTSNSGKNFLSFIALVSYIDEKTPVTRNQEKKVYFGPQKIDGYTVNPVNAPFTDSNGQDYPFGYPRIYDFTIDVYPGARTNLIANQDGGFTATYAPVVRPELFAKAKGRSVPKVEANITRRYTPSSPNIAPQAFNHLETISVHFENLGDKFEIKFYCPPPNMMAKAPTQPIATPGSPAVVSPSTTVTAPPVPLADKNSLCPEIKPGTLKILAADNVATPNQGDVQVELNLFFWGSEGTRRKFGATQRRVAVSQQPQEANFTITSKGFYEVNAFTIGEKAEGSTLTNRTGGPYIVINRIEYVLNANCELQPRTGNPVFEWTY